MKRYLPFFIAAQGSKASIEGTGVSRYSAKANPFIAFLKKSTVFALAFIVIGLSSFNAAFATKKKVTAVTYGGQTGVANAGTATSVTYTINLTEGSSVGGSTSTDNILLTWTSGTPAGVTWSFTSATQGVTGGTTTSPSFTPTGSNATITFTVTTSGSTPAGTYPFTIKITDNNGGGGPYNSGTVNLVVDAVPPTISYTGSPFTYYTGQTIASLTPTVTNSPTSYSLSPALPAGLAFDTSTGIISGTPTAISSATTYTITATNASGSGNTTISITVLASTISYTGSPFTYVNGTAITSLTPTVSGSPSSYSISPALSAGLSFSTVSGVISGTPTATAAATTYTITANYSAGITATTTINITVNPALPVISYSPSTNVYILNTAIGPLTPANTGGPATSWSISPGLPAGLSFDITTGIISGTPTVLASAVTYTITATNITGSGSTSVIISVNPLPPVISYSPSNNVYVKNVVIPTLTPVNTGGIVVSYAISPGLPAGLLFNTGTGIITGTPTTVSAATTYTITATNTGGTGSTTVTLEVDALPPSIAYTPATNTYFVGVAIPTLTPTVLTGNPTSYSINAPLPAGLSFNTTTGAITGTPTAITAATTYTITASNAGGSGNTTEKITIVNPPAPVISYSPSTNTYIVGTAITTLTPANTGGPPTGGYSISTALPAGLSFNTTTGVISGTPTAVSATTTYTISATNAGGTGNTTLTLTVNPMLPAISYSPSTNIYPVGSAIVSLTPTSTGGAVASYSISPGLPTGLSFNTGTGVISGTPTVVTTATTYTITATNVTGSATTTVNLTVNPIPPVISYTPSTNYYTVGTAISALTPTNTGGPVASYAISPALSAGLSFNTTTGVISGTPTIDVSVITYTITATNVAGSSSTTINITVYPAPPIISYTPSTNIYTVGSAITTLTPANTGGVSTNWVIGPSLPPGLSFNGTTGAISGAPLSTSPATTYTISADNAGGLGTTSVIISCINPTPPVISYTPSTNIYTVGTAISTLTPANTGGPSTSWSISTALPSGLSFDTTTGIISGTPTAVSGTTTYTITATNTAGTGNTTVTLTVNPSAPIFSYTPSSNTYSVGATISSLTPANTGGTPTGYSISAALPAGLSFNTTTGVISGTPTATSPLTNYTITAINATGSATTTVAISVNNSAPNISYSPGTVTYSVGSVITPATPGNTGGAASTWAITTGTLPAGITFNTSTGVFSGTPTAVFPTATFTIKATNGSGSSSTNLIITVSPHAPIISYSPSTVALTLNAAMTTMVPINTGGAVTGYSYSTTGVSLTGASLSGPSLMTIDASGNIYVANYNNGTISKWSSAHVYLGKYTTGKTLTNPEGIVFDSAGNSYVEDTGAGAVYKFGPTGAYISTIITGLNHPLGISIDPSDNLYIATYVSSSPYTSSVTKYSTAGVLEQTISNAQMDESDGVTVDGAGNIYVLNRAQDQPGTNKGYVTKYNSAGVYQSTFSSGYEDPLAISTDPSGDVFVADSHNNQVKIYSSNGVLLNTISGFNDVEGFVADGNGNLYVSDFTNNTVKEFAAQGGYYISAPLPAGLSFSTTTGQITGTPTVTFPATTYTITAYNITGSGTTTVTLSCIQSNDWIGATSTDWNTASNWLGNAVPTSAQSALIGVNRSFNFFPTVLTADGTVNVGSIQVGNLGGKAGGVIVNTGATLNVLGALTYQSDASSGSGYTATLSGAGTINANSISVISNTILASSYNTILASSVNSLNVTGNIALTSSISGAALFNSNFNVTGGTTLVTGVLQTTNTAGSTSSFVVIPTTTATLQLANTTALSGLSATGTNVVTFNNTGATVQYSGAAQTVYSSAAITGLPGGVSYQNIAFSGTGVKTASSGYLTVLGDFTNALVNDAGDYIDLSSPTVYFNGTTQSLAGGAGNGTTFYNVYFGGLGTKTMTSGLFNVASLGVLTMVGSSTSTVLATGGFLTLNSDATGSASVAAISGPVITGNVNVQRYVTGGAGYRSYRLGSSPVYAGTVSSNNVYSINYLQNSMYLTGSAGGGFDKTGNPSLYLYREDQVPSNASFISGNYWGINALNSAPIYNYPVSGLGGSGTFSIPVGNGFLYFFRGNRASASLATETTTAYTTPVAVTMTTTGPLTQGQVVVHSWYTPGSVYVGFSGIGTGGNYSVRGFNLLGNPYASSIDWESFTNATSTYGIYSVSVGSTVYELNDLTGNYDSYQKGGAYTNHGRRTIVSGQGFFVLATNSVSQIIFNESAKSTIQNTGANLFLATNIINDPAADQHLRLQLALDSINTDDIYVGFNSSYSPNYVVNEDAPYKPGNGKLSLSSFSGDGIQMAINKMPLGTSQTVIPLDVKARESGLYHLNMTEFNDIPQIYDVWLIDSYKNDSLDMKNNSTYAFTISADTNSQGARRFKLILRQDPSLAVHLVNFTGARASNGDKLNWVTQNEANYTNFTVERSTDGGTTYNALGGFTSNSLGTYSFLDAAPETANMYRLKMVDLNGVVTYSNIVTMLYANNNSSIVKNNIMLYPNPAQSIINLTINAVNPTGANQVISSGSNAAQLLTAGYTIRIMSAAGATVRTTTTTQQTWQTNVSTLLPGTYIMQVVSNVDNSLVGKGTFVKL